MKGNGMGSKTPRTDRSLVAPSQSEKPDDRELQAIERHRRDAEL